MKEQQILPKHHSNLQSSVGCTPSALPSVTLLVHPCSAHTSPMSPSSCRLARTVSQQDAVLCRVPLHRLGNSYFVILLTAQIIVAIGKTAAKQADRRWQVLTSSLVENRAAQHLDHQTRSRCRS